MLIMRLKDATLQSLDLQLLKDLFRPVKQADTASIHDAPDAELVLELGERRILEVRLLLLIIALEDENLDQVGR